MRKHISPQASIFLYLSFIHWASAQYSFTTCQQVIDSIINGTYSIGDINSETIGDYVYNGSVKGLKSNFPRSQYFCITYEGCKKICADDIALNDPQSAMTIAATWIFPLAILLSLPFESGIWATLAAISNWLGSPQTALTATLYNVVQITRCYLVPKTRHVDVDDQTWTNVHYVLSCFNQYLLPTEGINDKLDADFLRALVYGLLRPICISTGKKGQRQLQLTEQLKAEGQTEVKGQVLVEGEEQVEERAEIHVQVGMEVEVKVGKAESKEMEVKEMEVKEMEVKEMEVEEVEVEEVEVEEVEVEEVEVEEVEVEEVEDRVEEKEIQLNKELVSELAFQLRDQRRRSVLPTLISLAIYIATFGFSVAQAFVDGGENYPVLTLTSALFYAWLPMLVIFMLVDRNPNSLGRSAELMSRWLYNADAVRTWGTWTPDKEPMESDRRVHRPDVNWWFPGVKKNEHFRVRDFVGHGRTMHYCGLVYALLETVKQRQWITNPDFICDVPRGLTLVEKRPRSWYITAFVSLILVWAEVFLAVVVDFYTPSVGFGCWSGSIVLYAILSTPSWLIQFLSRPSNFLRAVAHTFNALAIAWILSATMMVVTGATDTCYCNTDMLNRQLGYSKFEPIMDFETFEFDREHFNVTRTWIIAASIGGLLPIAVFIVALLWWLRCHALWSADDKRGPVIRTINLVWLQSGV